MYLCSAWKGRAQACDWISQVRSQCEEWWISFYMYFVHFFYHCVFCKRNWLNSTTVLRPLKAEIVICWVRPEASWSNSWQWYQDARPHLNGKDFQILILFAVGEIHGMGDFSKTWGFALPGWAIYIDTYAKFFRVKAVTGDSWSSSIPKRFVINNCQSVW